MKGAEQAETSPELGSTMPGFLLAVAAALGVWLAAFNLLGPVPGVGDVGDRLVFGLRCSVVALLFTLLLGVEAVAHERLMGAAFDPLFGRETRRLRVNARYLQNTLEQSALFVPALLVLASWCRDGGQMRAVVAASVVFVAGRLAFWIGYRRSPRHRVYGLVGSAQTMLILLYGAARFGFEQAGVIGAVAPLALFAVAEAVIVLDVRR